MIREVQEFVLIRDEGYRKEFHVRLFGRAISLAIITAPAGGHDIRPNIDAASGERLNVISG